MAKIVLEYRGYVIQRDPQTTMYHIHSKGGSLPLSLTGLFTHQRSYESVIDAYIAAQEIAEKSIREAEELAKALITEQVNKDKEAFEELQKKAEEINKARHAKKD
jgi:hypothetical protein